MKTTHLRTKPIGISLEDLEKPLSWKAVFGNERPTELEIGFGKGGFLVSQSLAHPERNYFGIDWSMPLWRYTSDRLRRRGIANVRTVRAEAAEFLRDYVPDQSLLAVHVYFPDPWPKRRHHKRRLVQEKFLSQLDRTILPRGSFHFATDHEPYFKEAVSLLENSPFAKVTVQRFGLPGEAEFLGTNFEKIFRREGKLCFALTAARMAHMNAS